MVAQDEWSRDKAEFVARPADAPHPAGDPDRSPLARQFAQLTRMLLAADSVAGVLQHVAEAAVAVLPEVELVSVTLRSNDGALHTPVETDPLGAELDEWQYQFNEGPCLEAARTPGVAYTYSGDLADEPRWLRFGPKAAELGYRSVLSTAMLPDITPPRLSGALNLYSRGTGKLGDEATRDQALLLATHASLAVATTEAVRLAELEQVHLRRALETRDVIGQAKGILMQRRGISADEAFELLRRASQDLNIKLAEVARTVATRHAELGPPTG
ncbi:GAF and ANTAR domain-containing protein [Kibdelosporangium persicum]|uniref:Histidine kinase n=1 Tax=Kibdelosporangium persicum TaxID=2698649 RepID=A0ABX2F1I0_9PSEU|nr:GAF and ANTAR domain-containing protein [Kibdelosporangium persicum]NRN65171.1 Histidine kinase [Kibdelosporangium persicum]